MFRFARFAAFALLVIVGACHAPRKPAPAPVTPAALGASAAPLHNVQRVTGQLISGSMPEDDAGFDVLRAMGVRTVVSVDGATPDLARAHARGMRYVHVPVGYGGIDTGQALTLARAVRDLPGPVYVHCHHGKHRGPAACAVIAIELGQMQPADGDAFLRRAGTSPDYPGLFASVAAARPLDRAQLDAAPSDFPEIAPRPSFVKAMSQAQDAFDHLAEIRDAGWAVPQNHPDLVPPAEAARLESLLRGLLDDTETKQGSPEFQQLMAASQAAAAEFEAALSSRASKDDLAARFKHLGDSCRDCHVQYRNVRR